MKIRELIEELRQLDQDADAGFFIRVEGGKIQVSVVSGGDAAVLVTNEDLAACVSFANPSGKEYVIYQPETVSDADDVCRMVKGYVGEDTFWLPVPTREQPPNKWRQ